MRLVELAEEREDQLRQLFFQHDVDKSGFIDIQEMKQVLVYLGLLMEELADDAVSKTEVHMKRADQNRDKKLDFKEFVDYFNAVIDTRQFSRSVSAEAQQAINDKSNVIIAKPSLKRLKSVVSSKDCGSASLYRVLADVVRYLTRYNLRLQQFPDRALLWAYDTPSNSHMFQRLKKEGRVPSGRMLYKRFMDWPTEQVVMRDFEKDVASIAYFPDGKVVLAASSKTLFQWDTSQLGAPATHQTSALLYQIAVSSCGTAMATGEGDNHVVLWDTATGQQRAVLKGHTNHVQSVAFSPAGTGRTLLASGSRDKTAGLFDLQEGRMLVQFTGHEGWVNEVHFNSSGDLLATASDDKTARLWDVATGQQRGVLKGHGNYVRTIVFVTDSELATGSKDKTVRIWHWNQMAVKQVSILKGHKLGVNSIAASANAKLLVSGSDDKTIRIWDLVKRRALTVLEGHKSPVRVVQIRRDGKQMASGSDDCTMRLWDLDHINDEVPKGHTNNVLCVAWHPDPASRILASGSDDNTVRFWNADTGEQLGLLKGHSDGVNCVEFSADGMTVATASYDKTIRLWDTRHYKQRGVVLQGHENWVHEVRFSPDQTTLASCSKDQTLMLWDAVLGETTASMQHDDEVRSVQWVDASTLLSGCKDGTVRLWSAETKAEATRFEGHTKAVNSVAVTRNGATGASASDDSTVRLWDLEAGATAALAVMEGHTGPVRSVVFSPDATTLASTSDDKTVCLWDNYVGELRQVLKGHGDEVASVAFSADGSTVASASSGRMVRVWDIRAGILPEDSDECSTPTQRKLGLELKRFKKNRSQPLLASSSKGLNTSLVQRSDMESRLAQQLNIEHLREEQKEFILRSGVSVAFLIDIYEQITRDFPGRALSTKEVVTEVIIPATAQRRSRYIELEAMEHMCGRPDLFVSHMWSGEFGKVVARVLEALGNADPDRVYVWVDIFAINQHDPDAMLDDLKLLQECLRASTSGTLLVMDQVGDMAPLKRAWCVYEIWSTLHLRGEHCLFSANKGLDPMTWMHMVDDLDIEHCTAFDPNDRTMILQSVEETVGISSMNARVKVKFILEPQFFHEDLQRLRSPGRLVLSLYHKWLLDAPDYGKMLWLRGVPGGGKSTISAAIVEKAMAEIGKAPSGRAGPTLLYFFVRHNDIRRRDPIFALKTFAHQLFTAFPEEVGEYYVNIGMQGMMRLSGVEQTFQRLLREPIMRKLPGEQIVVLIDAIDEGLMFGEETMSLTQKCLSNPMLQLVSNYLRRLPKNVSVVVTSREGKQHNYLQHMLMSHSSEAVTTADISNFIIQEESQKALRRTLEGNIADEAKLQRTMDTIQHVSEGSMVFYRILDELVALSGVTFLDASLPAGLLEAYRAYVEALERAGQCDIAKLVDVVELLCAASEPLSISQLLQFGLKDVQRTIASAGFLFHVSAEFKVNPFHKTVFDFFLDPQASRGYCVSKQVGHARLFDALAEELQREATPSAYCLRNLVMHGQGAGKIWQLENIVGDVDFWQLCYEAGVGQAVFYDLTEMCQDMQVI